MPYVARSLCLRVLGRDGFTNALLNYSQGTGDWDAVKKAYVDNWPSEMAEQQKKPTVPMPGSSTIRGVNGCRQKTIG